MPLQSLSLITLAGVVTLAGCAATPAVDTSAPTTPAASASSVGGAADTGDVLATVGVAGMTAQEAVEHLDQLDEQRPLDFRGSVTGTQLILATDEANTVALPLPDDQFYLSIAPYQSTTHDCFNHSLATCRGEMAGEPVRVTITGEDGTVLVDEDATTYRNGFVGFWLPRGIGATVEVTADGRTGSAEIRTDDDSPTCLTTVQLT
ncbi:CueP family metal-binding protein [Propioniciclava soli]|uniref:CueP family metal-binding protein n=2 Tax=Propioniciclava soli TaxID=2775081 RepID=A0ABZ3CCM9_9ACTN